MTRTEFATVFTPMLEAYRKTMSEGAADLYYSALRHLPVEKFSAACTKAVQSSRFFPTIAEILEQGGGSRKSIASREWDVVAAAVQGIGAYQSVCFNDPVTAKAVLSLGGWQGLCRPSEDWVFVRKRFIQSWLDYDQVREDVEDCPPVNFAGLHEEAGGRSKRYRIGEYHGTQRPALPEGPQPRRLGDGS